MRGVPVEARPSAPTAQGVVDRIRAASATARLVLAVGLVAGAPYMGSSTSDEQVRFGLLVAFGWIPVASVLTTIGRRHRHPALDLATVAWDLGLLALVAAAVGADPLVLAGWHLLMVATWTYVAGRTVGIVASLGGAVVVGAALTDRSGGANRFELVGYPVVALLLCWLLDLAAADRSQASAGLRRTLEKSDAILTGIAEAVVVSSPRGRVAEWNRAAERVFDCPAGAAVGGWCTDLLALRHGVRELDCAAGCALLRLGGGDGTDVELWRLLPTGQRQPLLASSVPLLDTSGRVVEVVHSFRDITRLKQADEAKTLFLATASHELKTPLTVIRGFSQMLLLPDASLDDAERESALRAIERRAGQLNGIVDRLLMSSRIEAGRIDLSLRAVDIVPMLTERIEALSSSAGREVRLEVDPSTTAVWADVDAVTTIVDHLLDNAVKYSPNGGAIAVGTAVSDLDVTISVRDSGVGMTSDQLASCFERFWQAEPTDVRRFGGTGIGLYIVRSLAEALEGSVSAESAPGDGTTFRVALRRADRTPAPATGQVEAELAAGRGDRSIIREYMRQLGIGVEA